MRRVSAAEYRNTVVALLHGRGASGPLPVGFKNPIADSTSPLDRYTNFASTASVGDTQLADVFGTAEIVAAAYADKVGAAAGSCLESGPFAECARSLVRAAGEILFRRPLAPEQEAAFVKLATDAVPAGNTPKAALAAAVKAMLIAPDMLFHVELGRGKSPTGPVLDAFEVASAIASALASGPPDEPLWQAAKGNALGNAEQIRPHVARLLGDLGKAPPALLRFVRELFGYEKVSDVFKEDKFHDPEGLIRDTDALVAELIAKNGRAGFFPSLLTTRSGYASAATVWSYGLDPRMVTAKSPLRIEALPQRAGLLTQPSFLAANSENTETAPVKRGMFVREEVLCQPVPALPIGVVPVLPDVPMTARQKLAIHNEKPECRGCHTYMDSFGLALEIYDHLGRYRTTDHGAAIDATGLLDGSGNQDGSFKDGLELTAKLAASTVVQQCMARQLFRFLTARPEREVDGCAISQMTSAAQRSNGDVTELIVAAFAADSFRTRIGK